MNIIQPDTSLWVLAGVGLDNSYKHTYSWCFMTSSNQAAAFMQKRKFTFNQFTPVKGENVVTVPATPDSLYDCDYIMFQNNNYGSKYFYAFITDIEWVNSNVSRIHYEIDVIQTWHRYLNINSCFVEREHATNDTVGRNIVPENLELGEYVVNAAPITIDELTAQWKIVAACTVNKQGTDASGNMYGGVYSGLTYNVFDTPSEIGSFIDNLVTKNKGSAIVSIFMFPEAFITSTGTYSPTKITETITKNSSTIDSYTPTNKKLLTYPFNFLMCSNNMGAVAEFKYEFFNGSNCQFSITMDYSPSGSAVCAPKNYNGVDNENMNEKITLDGLPICPWATDAYKAWLAQNGSATSIHNLGTAFSGLASLFSLNIPGAVSAGFSIAESMARQNAISAQPPQAHGATGSTTLLANDLKTFTFYKMSIRASFARRIDAYFNKYGYAQKTIMKPNVQSRTTWNYVETRDATFTNIGAPADAQRKLSDIYDSGVTFWHTWNIGQYDRTNPIK